MPSLRNKVVQLVLLGTVLGALAGLAMHLIPWLPPAGSTQADRTDEITWAINYVSFVILGWVMAVMLYSIWKFRRRDDEDMRDGPPVHGHTGLEIFWTAIPVLIVSVFGVWAGFVLVDNEEHSSNTRVVVAQGQQYSWTFTYPDDGNFTTGTLMLPVGQTVEIHTASKDTIHDFFVKEWRVKMDAVPGQFASVWATPTRKGTFRVLCAELCGPGHAGMSTTNVVKVVDPGDFDKFVSDERSKASRQPPGAALFTRQGCGGCHAFTPAGSTGNVGPPLNDLASAAKEAGRPGNTADFVFESIAQPDAYVAPGYPGNVMPNFGDQLSQDQINDLVDYLLAKEGGEGSS